MRRLAIIKILVVGMFLIFPPLNQIRAQGSISGAAYHVVIEDETIIDGHVISLTDGSYHLSHTTYDPNLYGVVTLTPGIEIQEADGAGRDTHPVVSSGETRVLVTTTNGAIEYGDYITSSDIPGVAMKADGTGYVLGQALDDYDRDEVGKIKASIKITFPNLANIQDLETEQDTPLSRLEKTLSNLFNFEDLTQYQSPDRTFRLLLALVVFLLTIILAVTTFAKTARTGIESLGRNPLASRAISLGIILNVLITVGIILGGVLVGFYILTG